MQRRRFLTGTLAGMSAIAAGSRPHAQSTGAIDIDGLRRALAGGDATVLAASDDTYGAYQRYAAANLRVARPAAARVLIRTREGAAVAVSWLRDNGVTFSIRGGGHCYEAFSQNEGVVLDMRGMADVRVDDDGRRVSVGGGALLGQIFEALSDAGRIIPAGSCPQVGAAGHTLGGGYGMFARKFGLTCDSLFGVEMVDAQGRILTASTIDNPDLFWALRGGGAGSFGVVTGLTYRTTELPTATRFVIDWGADDSISISKAVDAFRAWQAWVPTAPRELTPILRISGSSGQPRLHCFGISTRADEDWVTRQLARLAQATGGQIGSIVTQSTGDLVRRFGGSGDQLTSTIDDTDFFAPVFYKGKSDVVTAPLSTDSATALISAIADTGNIVAICDPYGGAISDIAEDAMAFVHRGRTLYNIQYYTEWTKQGDTAGRMGDMGDVYAALHNIRSGEAYFNYCDLDLDGRDYGAAYWGSNLNRLKQIKQAYDPDNLFRHAQSVVA